MSIGDPRRFRIEIEDEPSSPETEAETPRERELRLEAEKWKRLAMHDQLTGVLSRLGLELEAESVLKGEAPKIPDAPGGRPRSLEEKRKEVDFGKSCLLYFDLDHFKTVNDGLGHATGDQALIAITNYWRERVREFDILARLGGDEFVIIFRGVSAEEMYSALLKEGEDVASVHFPVRIEGKQFDLKLSGGLADIDPAKKKNLSQILDEADKLLYIAKNQGRNQLMTASRAKKLQEAAGEQGRAAQPDSSRDQEKMAA